jgi:hypothetical protein
MGIVIPAPYYLYASYSSITSSIWVQLTPRSASYPTLECLIDALFMMADCFIDPFYACQEPNVRRFSPPFCYPTFEYPIDALFMMADCFIDPFYACQVPNVSRFSLIIVEKSLILVFSE